MKDQPTQDALRLVNCLVERAGVLILELESVVHYNLLDYKHSDSGFTRKVRRVNLLRESKRIENLQTSIRHIKEDLATAISSLNALQL